MAARHALPGQNAQHSAMPASQPARESPDTVVVCNPAKIGAAYQEVHSSCLLYGREVTGQVRMVYQDDLTQGQSGGPARQSPPPTLNAGEQSVSHRLQRTNSKTVGRTGTNGVALSEKVWHSSAKSAPDKY